MFDKIQKGWTKFKKVGQIQKGWTKFKSGGQN